MADFSAYRTIETQTKDQPYGAGIADILAKAETLGIGPEKLREALENPNSPLNKHATERAIGLPGLGRGDKPKKLFDIIKDALASTDVADFGYVMDASAPEGKHAVREAAPAAVDTAARLPASASTQESALPPPEAAQQPVAAGTPAGNAHHAEVAALGALPAQPTRARQGSANKGGFRGEASITLR